ncbi:hypothetical protein CYY_002966 [Polysphondylium violaceum]|uniref:Acyl-coenzyme A oxidase n=1 Tax=Polysphondylium violaceum TaxID=133409 RepID=A0A8J4PVH3_9MYCE|nr:hypothetical protein CYY_002966 [Polysphondylium violaceum]
MSPTHAEIKVKLRELAKSERFQKDVQTLSKEEQVENLYNLMTEVGEIAQVKADDIINDLGKVFAVMESPCLIFQYGLGTLLGTHYNLGMGTIMQLIGDNREQLQDYIDDLENFRYWGIFMATELDCGSNAMSMQTEAHFDVNTQEFIINTPSLGACKFMPYLSSKHQPKMAIVMARLWLSGQDCGIHPFIVHCRDRNGQLLPGVYASKAATIDMYRVCEVDHSITAFKNVRIPHKGFLGGALNRVTRDGKFVTKAKNKRDIFFQSFCRVESGKMVLIAALMPMFKLAISVAIEYSKKRRIMTKGGTESLTKVLSHKLDLAKAYISLTGSICLYEKMKRICLSEKLPQEKHQYCNETVKTMCVEVAREALQICLARTGAQGKLIRNRIVTAILANDKASTAEGDNLPVMLKIAKDLLFNDYQPLSCNDNDITLPITHKQRLLFLLHTQEKIAKRVLREKLMESGNPADAWIHSTQLARHLAWAHGMCEMADSLKHRSDIQDTFCMLHILKEGSWFIINSLVTKDELETLASVSEKNLSTIFDQQAVHVAKEYDIVDILALTPIGNKNTAKAWCDISDFNFTPIPSSKL